MKTYNSQGVIMNRFMLALMTATIGAAVVAVFTTFTTAAAFIFGAYVGSNMEDKKTENTEQS